MKYLKFLSLLLIAYPLLAVVPPEDAIIAETGSSLSSIEKHYLVEDGVSISIGGIRNTVYVQKGGNITQIGGIGNTVYLENGATVGQIRGIDAVVYENQIIGDAFAGGWVWLHESQSFFWSAITEEWYFYFPFWYSTEVEGEQKIGLFPPQPKEE